MSAPLPLIFDRQLYLARQQKASGRGIDLETRILEDLNDRIALLTRHFEKALVIAPSGSRYHEHVGASGKFDAVTHCVPSANDDLQLQPGQFNAILSLLDLHAVNDVPGYLAQLQAALQPDGLLMVCFFAGDTLAELRESWLAAEVEETGGASPRVAPMIALREFGGLLQRAGLALPVADMDRVTLRYADALALMREVKLLGYANALHGRSAKPTSRRFLLRVVDHYQSHFADADGRVRATLELAWANAWKPHPSQPQALKPGSAKARLAEALKVAETKI
jgi:SAM-dependent methyltransferase